MYRPRPVAPRFAKNRPPTRTRARPRRTPSALPPPSFPSYRRKPASDAARVESSPSAHRRPSTFPSVVSGASVPPSPSNSARSVVLANAGPSSTTNPLHFRMRRNFRNGAGGREECACQARSNSRSRHSTPGGPSLSLLAAMDAGGSAIPTSTATVGATLDAARSTASTRALSSTRRASTIPWTALPTSILARTNLDPEAARSRRSLVVRPTLLMNCADPWERITTLDCTSQKYRRAPSSRQADQSPFTSSL